MAQVASALAGHRLIALDSSVWIYHFESAASLGRHASEVIGAVAAGRVEAVSSELVLLELLVAPMRKDMHDVADEIELLLTRHPHFALLPVSREVLIRAAELRARHRLRTPDAIMLATALLAGATLAVTNDRKWRRIDGIEVMVLGDLNK